MLDGHVEVFLLGVASHTHQAKQINTPKVKKTLFFL